MGLLSCIDDRLPPEPVEVERPNFVSFESIGKSGVNVDLNSQIVMDFNEKMDLSTFPGNFEVVGVSGTVAGTFEYSTSADSAVVFTPSSNYQPAEIYEVSVFGGVRDINGNSMISPNDEDEPQTMWFFTGGEYSQDGSPYVFVRDKSSKQVIYRVGNINDYKDNLYVEADEEDFQTSAIEISPGAERLFMINLKATAGTVTVIDPQSFTVVGTSEVGLGPTNITFSDSKAYVTNNSGKSFSVIDLNSLQTESTTEFNDGFRPKDVVYSPLTNKLYFYHSTQKTIRVVDANNYDTFYDLTNILDNSKAIDIEISEDGKYIFLLESNSSRILVMDVNTEHVSKIIDLGFEYNIDGTVGGQNYYVAYYRRISNDDVGGILKIDIPSLNISESLSWEYEVDQIGLTTAEELLYAVVPSDSTVKMVETKTMRNISQTKVNGSLKYVAVSRSNYK